MSPNRPITNSHRTTSTSPVNSDSQSNSSRVANVRTSHRRPQQTEERRLHDHRTPVMQDADITPNRGQRPLFPEHDVDYYVDTQFKEAARAQLDQTTEGTEPSRGRDFSAYRREPRTQRRAVERRAETRQADESRRSTRSRTTQETTRTEDTRSSTSTSRRHHTSRQSFSARVPYQPSGQHTERTGATSRPVEQQTTMTFGGHEYVELPYKYDSWKPSYPPKGYRLHKQAEIPPFVYDPVYHSILDRSILPELVARRAHEIRQREGYSSKVANRIAVAGIQGEYNRIMPFMLKLYIRSYQAAVRKEKPDEGRRPPSRLYYPDSNGRYPSDWVRSDDGTNPSRGRGGRGDSASGSGRVTPENLNNVDDGTNPSRGGASGRRDRGSRDSVAGSGRSTPENLNNVDDGTNPSRGAAGGRGRGRQDSIAGSGRSTPENPYDENDDTIPSRGVRAPGASSVPEGQPRARPRYHRQNSLENDPANAWRANPNLSRRGSNASDSTDSISSRSSRRSSINPNGGDSVQDALPVAGAVPSNYNQPYAAFEAQQYFNMPNFRYENGIATPETEDPQTRAEAIRFLQALVQIPEPRQRILKLHELTGIPVPSTAQPDFWQDALEMGFPLLERTTSRRWRPVGIMSNERATAIHSLAKELERNENPVNRQNLLNRVRVSEFGQRTTQPQPKFLDSARLYFDFPHFARVAEQQMWTPIGDLRVSRRLDYEKIVNELEDQSPQERIHRLSAWLNNETPSSYRAPIQPRRLREWQTHSQIGVPYFYEETPGSGVWIPIGNMDDEMRDSLSAIASDLMALETPEQRITYLQSNGLIPTDIETGEPRRQVRSTIATQFSSNQQPSYWKHLTNSIDFLPLLTPVRNPQTGQYEYQVPNDEAGAQELADLHARFLRDYQALQNPTNNDLNTLEIQYTPEIRNLAIRHQWQPRDWLYMMRNNSAIARMQARLNTDDGRARVIYVIPGDSNEATRRAENIFNTVSPGDLYTITTRMRGYGMFADPSAPNPAQSRENAANLRETSWWNIALDNDAPPLTQANDGNWVVDSSHPHQDAWNRLRDQLVKTLDTTKHQALVNQTLIEIGTEQRAQIPANYDYWAEMMRTFPFLPPLERYEGSDGQVHHRVPLNAQYRAVLEHVLTQLENARQENSPSQMQATERAMRAYIQSHIMNLNPHDIVWAYIQSVNPAIALFDRDRDANPVLPPNANRATQLAFQNLDSFNPLEPNQMDSILRELGIYPNPNAPNQAASKADAAIGKETYWWLTAYNMGAPKIGRNADTGRWRVGANERHSQLWNKLVVQLASEPNTSLHPSMIQLTLDHIERLNGLETLSNRWQDQPDYWRDIRAMGVRIPPLERNNQGGWRVKPSNNPAQDARLQGLQTTLHRHRGDPERRVIEARRFGFYPDTSLRNPEQRAASNNRASSGMETGYWQEIQAALNTLLEGEINTGLQISRSKQHYRPIAQELNELFELIVSANNDLVRLSITLSWFANRQLTRPFALNAPELVQLRREILEIYSKAANRQEAVEPATAASMRWIDTHEQQARGDGRQSPPLGGGGQITPPNGRVNPNPAGGASPNGDKVYVSRAFLNIAQSEFGFPEFTEQQNGTLLADREDLTVPEHMHVSKLLDKLQSQFDEAASPEEGMQAQRVILNLIRQQIQRAHLSNQLSPQLAAYRKLMNMSASGASTPSNPISGRQTPSNNRVYQNSAFLNYPRSHFGFPEFRHEENGEIEVLLNGLTEEEHEHIQHLMEQLSEVYERQGILGQGAFLLNLLDDIAHAEQTGRMPAHLATYKKVIRTRPSGADPNPNTNLNNGRDPNNDQDPSGGDMPPPPPPPPPPGAGRTPPGGGGGGGRDENGGGSGGRRPTNPASVELGQNRLRSRIQQPNFWSRIQSYRINIGNLSANADGSHVLPEEQAGGPSFARIRTLYAGISTLDNTDAVDQEAMRQGLRPNPAYRALEATSPFAVAARETIEEANRGESLYWLKEAIEALRPYPQMVFRRNARNQIEGNHTFLNSLILRLLPTKTEQERQLVVNAWMAENRSLVDGSAFDRQTQPIEQPAFWNYIRSLAPFLPELVRDSDTQEIITKPKLYDTIPAEIYNRLLELNLGNRYDLDQQQVEKEIRQELRCFGVLTDQELVNITTPNSSQQRQINAANDDAAHYQELHYYNEVLNMLYLPPRLVRLANNTWGFAEGEQNRDQWGILLTNLRSVETSQERIDIINQALLAPNSVFVSLEDMMNRIDLSSQVETTRTSNDEPERQSMQPYYWRLLMQLLDFRVDSQTLPSQRRRETSMLIETDGQWQLVNTDEADRTGLRGLVSALNRYPDTDSSQALIRKTIKLYGRNPDIQASDSAEEKVKKINLARIGRNSYWMNELIEETMEVEGDVVEGQVPNHRWPALTRPDGSQAYVRYAGLHFTQDATGRYLVPASLEGIASELMRAVSSTERRNIVLQNRGAIDEAVSIDRAQILEGNLNAEDAMNQHVTRINAYHKETQAMLGRRILIDALLADFSRFEQEARDLGLEHPEYHAEGRIEAELQLYDEQIVRGEKFSTQQFNTKLIEYKNAWVATRILERDRLSELARQKGLLTNDPSSEPEDIVVQDPRRRRDSVSSQRSDSPELEPVYTNIFDGRPRDYPYQVVEFDDQPLQWRVGILYLALPYLVSDEQEVPSATLTNHDHSLMSLLADLSQIEISIDEHGEYLKPEAYAQIVEAAYRRGLINISELMAIVSEMQTDQIFQPNWSGIPRSLKELILSTQIGWWRPAVEHLNAPLMVENPGPQLLNPFIMDDADPRLAGLIALADQLAIAGDSRTLAQTQPVVRDTYLNSPLLQQVGDQNQVEQARTALRNLQLSATRRLIPKPHPLRDQIRAERQQRLA